MSIQKRSLWLVPLLLFGIAQPTTSVDASKISVYTVYDAEGVSFNGRTFVPLRVVSENLGADVRWNQVTKQAEIRYTDKRIVFSAHWNRVELGDRHEYLDTAPKILNNRLYVPIRPLFTAFGGYLNWDASIRQSSYTLGGRTVRIGFPSETHPAQVTPARMRVLANAANRAATPSQYTQIRKAFSPYFTDQYINEIIKYDGTRNSKDPFIDVPSLVNYGGQPTIHQGFFPIDAGGLFVDRRLILMHTDGKWLIDDIDFSTSIP